MLILARLGLLAYSGILITLCLIDVGSSSIKPIMMFDKILHISAYFTFGFLAFFASITRPQFFTLLLIGFALGVSLEIAQATLTSYRGGDLADQVANTLGLLISFQLCNLRMIKQYWPLK